MELPLDSPTSQGRRMPRTAISSQASWASSGTG